MLPVLCSQGYSRDGMRTIACCCRHDFWLMHRWRRRAGDEGRLAALIAEGGRASPFFEATSVSANVMQNQMLMS